MYVYKTEPYEHQRDIFENTRDKEAFALLLEMGCGKSKIIIDNLAYLYGERKVEAALIIAPSGVHRNWAVNEVPAHLPDRVPRQVVVWESSRNTKAYRKDLEALFNGAEELKVLLVNVEAFSTKRGAAFGKKFVEAFGRAMIVVDESSTLKSVKARRTKAILRLHELAAYRRILTGTPVTQSHLDLFTQFAFLDPKIIGINSYYVFRAHYSVIVKRKAHRVAKDGKRQEYTFDDILRPRNLEELKARIAPHSARLTKQECLDLPPKAFTEILVQI